MVNQVKQWMRLHKFESHLIAFLMMLITSFSLYFAAENSIGNTALWGLIALFAAANILTILIP